MTAIMDQFLDQLGARGLVLDQHDIRIDLVVLLLAHGALERRIYPQPSDITSSSRSRSAQGGGSRRVD